MTKTLEIIVVFVLVIIVVLSIGWFSYRPEGGAVSKITKAIQTLIAGAPKVTYGEKEITASKPTLQNLRNEQEIKELQKTILKMKSSVKKYCFASYGGFTPFEEEGTSITARYDQKDDETTFQISGGVGGRQQLRDLEFSIKEIVPCVIAGSSTITKSFEGSFLNTNLWDDKRSKIEPNHYNPVTQLIINHEGINYGQGVHDFFEDGGYLYTPDNKHICFFPTIDGTNSCRVNTAEGLDDDCLGEAAGKENSIPAQLQKGTLQEC
ncbi:hypothetical protein J4421_06225 [Candidatus Woesearchaeota archaeon]|nr:hypothetical protein [Candidatus Woesearchaeota archaeon]